jgi:hypothetical protein
MKRRKFLRIGAAALAVRPVGAGRPVAAAGTDWSVSEFHARRRFLRMRGGRVAYLERGAVRPHSFCTGGLLTAITGAVPWRDDRIYGGALRWISWDWATRRYPPMKTYLPKARQR